MNRGKWGTLEGTVVERSPRPDEPIDQTVVLLHGYGAPGTDLVGLANEIESPQNTRYVFLQAPHPLAGMSGPHAGRAWWEIDMIQLQVIMMTKNYDTLALSHPPGLDEATAQLNEALEALLRASDLSWGNCYVGGFSQGAMLSCNWTLQHKRPIAGLIQLSGTVLRQNEWTHALDELTGLRVFQSHSPQDPVLPFELALKLKAMFELAHSRHSWVTFGGGHGIGRAVLLELSKFLS